MSPRQQAKAKLCHFFSMAGVPVVPPMDAEIDSIVDDVISAAVSETLDELIRKLGGKP